MLLVSYNVYIYNVISFMQCEVVSVFLQVHMSIQDQSFPLSRVHGCSQPVFLGYPQVVGALPPEGNMNEV